MLQQRDKLDFLVRYIKVCDRIISISHLYSKGMAGDSLGRCRLQPVVASVFGLTGATDA